MDDKLGVLNRRVSAIERDTGVTDLRAENESLRKQQSLHTKILDELESYSRSDNLVTRGSPENTFAERAPGSPNTLRSTTGAESQSGRRLPNQLLPYFT